MSNIISTENKTRPGKELKPGDMKREVLASGHIVETLVSQPTVEPPPSTRLKASIVGGSVTLRLENGELVDFDPETGGSRILAEDLSEPNDLFHISRNVYCDIYTVRITGLLE